MSGFSNPIVGGGGALVYPSIHSPNYPAIPSWSINKDGSASFSGSVTSGGTITGANISFANGYLSNGDGTFSNTPGLLLYSSNPPNKNNLLLSDCPAPGTDKFGNQIVQGFTIYQLTSAVTLNTNMVHYTSAGDQTTGWTQDNLAVQTTATNTNVSGPANLFLEAGTQIELFINGTAVATLTASGMVWTLPETLPELILAAQGATPAVSAGNGVLFANAAGVSLVLDGTDQTTYNIQTRRVTLAGNSGAISSATPASVGLSTPVSANRTYRFFARLYITTTSTPQFGFDLVVPGAGLGADGLIGGCIFRAATWIGSVQSAPNNSAGIAIALSAGVTYMVDIHGEFLVGSTSGNANLNVFDVTGGVGSYTVNKWSFIEVSPI